MNRSGFARRTRQLVVGSCLAFSAGCVGTTGGQVIDFDAAAAGPPDANGELDFMNSSGWQIALTSAKLHVGAVYLVEALPTSGAQATSCILPSTYVAEVTDGLDVDLLSSSPQAFPARGHGTTSLALAGQVWLTQGLVDSPEQTTPILELAGTASLGSELRPFSARVTISASNRTPNASDSPFANPICKQRVVSPIVTTVQVEDRGGLLLRVDPRLLFVNVDFGALGLSADGKTYAFRDDSSDQPSVNLYQNLHAASSLYSFSWRANLK